MKSKQVVKYLNNSTVFKSSNSVLNPALGTNGENPLKIKGFSYLPDRNPIDRFSFDKMSQPRYKNLRIYYGVNNLKKGVTEYDAKGRVKFDVDPSKEWYVRYDFHDEATQKDIPITVRRGLNRVKGLNEKMLAAEALMQTVKEELDNGFNPLTERYESQKAGQDGFEEVKLMSFRNAMAWAMIEKNKERKLSKSTNSTYKTNIDYLSEALEQLGYGQVPIVLLKRGHIKDALSRIPSIRPDITEKGVNEYLSNISGLLTYLVGRDVLESNPAANIPKIRESITEGFVPPTDEDFETIKKELGEAPFGFRLYCMLIYLTGIRPKELNKIQVQDIDFKELYIRMVHESETADEKTKTGKSRQVAITKDAAKLLKEQIAGNSNPAAFPFGKGFKCTDEFCHRNRYSEYWKKIIKDKHGISNDMYSLKSRGTDDRQNDHVLFDDALAHLYGHSSTVLVRTRYKRKKKKLDEVIRLSTPDFTEKGPPKQ